MTWKKVTLCLLALSSGALAQSVSGFELQQLRPNPNPSEGGFVSLSPTVLPRGEWRAHAVFNYASNPLILYNSLDERVAGAVSRQATLHLLGAVGLWNFLELGVDLPVVVHQAGEAMPAGIAPSVVHSVGFGDLRIVPKAKLLTLRSEAIGAEFVVAGALDLFLPTGDPAGLRGGDLRIGPSVAVEAAFSGGRHLGSNVGYLYRAPREFGGLRIADTFGWSLYAETPVLGPLAVRAEVFGRLGDAGQGRLHAPLEALLGVKATPFGVEVLAAVGAGVGRSYGTPDWRGLLSMQVPLGRRTAAASPVQPAPPLVSAAPSAPREEPPAVVEPPPEPVVSAPVEPEPVPPMVEAAPPKVRVNRGLGRLELADTIHFKTASAEIADRSFPLLDEVAVILFEHPEIKVLIIEGHTDIRGGRQYNLKLSRARADSLRHYIIGKGVDASRLQALGFGPDQPVADNGTEAGRATNRRVDFRIAELTWETGGE
ncbi:MAG: OmpA family protein [Myxococcota bacterium]|nr:OmpA family protein [Myxococcota bacterium]